MRLTCRLTGMVICCEFWVADLVIWLALVWWLSWCVLGWLWFGYWLGFVGFLVWWVRWFAGLLGCVGVWLGVWCRYPFEMSWVLCC